MLGTESDTGKLIDGLVARVGADPASASFKQAPYREIKRHLAEHGPGDDRPQGHPYSKSEFFRRPLPREAIVSLVETFSEGRVAGQSRELDFTPWGGAYNRVRPDVTAFAHRDELFLLKHAVTVDPDASTTEREAARGWLGHSWATVRPWGSGRVYPNFLGQERELLAKMVESGCADLYPLDPSAQPRDTIGGNATNGEQMSKVIPDMSLDGIGARG